MSDSECALGGGLPGVRLKSSAGFTCEVFRHGAHVASWKTAEGDDLIFLSKQVRRETGLYYPRGDF